MISRTKYIISTLLGLALLVASCEDEPFPAGFEGNIVFKADGNLDNNALYLEAGQEDFYMFTDVELKDDLMRFSGAFQKNDFCEAPALCDEKLKIIINNYKFGTDFEIDSALYIGDYLLEPDTQTGSAFYNVDFLADPEGSAPFTYTWDFGNGSTSTLQNPIQTYSNLDSLEIELFMIDNNGCETNYKETLSSQPINTCGIDFSYTVVIDSFFNANAYSFFTANIGSPNEYTWEFTPLNGGNPWYDSSTLQSSILDTANIFPAKVCLIRNDSNSCDVTICKTIDNTSFCGVSFTYTPDFIITPGDTSIFSIVVIEYTTPNGEFYSSELGSQAGSTFEILKLDDYLQNERDQPTKSIEAAVDCKLYNAAGEFLNFTTNELIFSVSVPD